jgi:KTSC domain
MPGVQPLRNSASGWQAGYDEEAQTLTVVFPNGKSYEYLAVPPDIWKGLQEASSAGVYFHLNIRNQYG